MGNSFNPKQVQLHQIQGLLDSLEGMYQRIADQPWIAGGGTQQKKPFDCLWIKAKEAYVIPIFYKPRKYKKAFLIPLKIFWKMEKSVKLSELESMNLETFNL